MVMSSKQKKILIPTINSDSWKSLLAEPEKQWKEGFSAKSAADSWESSKGFPKEIVLAMNKISEFNNAELLMAIPEFKVCLDNEKAPSQNDILGLCSNESGLTVFTVESKVHEDFDKLIKDWNDSEGKKNRLTFLLEKIAYPNIDVSNLRYQLFHRLASAVIMAEKFHAKNALMIVQSFEANDALNHYSDFKAFIENYGVSSQKEIPIKVARYNGIDIYVLWVNS